jgi:hypothetical protein
MTSHRDAIPVAVLVSLIVGALVGSVLVMSSEDNAVGDLLPRLFAAALLGVLASAPVSLPLGLLGGALAATMLGRAQARWTGRRWVGIGVLSGAMLGSVGSGLYCVSFNGTDVAAVSFFLAIGGLAGATSGAIVGAWCTRKQISSAVSGASL